MTVIPINTKIIDDPTAETLKEWGVNLISPNAVRKALPSDNSDVTIEIDSPGGLVTAGSSIATLLKDYPGKVTAKIIGQAASAATIVALAADRVLMSPTATFMVHRVSVAGVEGNSGDLEKYSDVLTMQDKMFAETYAKKTGKSVDDMLKLMTDETYMSADKAKELGFIDDIMFDDQSKLVAGPQMVLTPEMLDALKNYKTLKEKASSLDLDALADKIISKLKDTKTKEPEKPKVDFSRFLF